MAITITLKVAATHPAQMLAITTESGDKWDRAVWGIYSALRERYAHLAVALRTGRILSDVEGGHSFSDNDYAAAEAWATAYDAALAEDDEPDYDGGEAFDHRLANEIFWLMEINGCRPEHDAYLRVRAVIRANRPRV